MAILSAKNIKKIIPWVAMATISWVLIFYQSSVVTDQLLHLYYFDVGQGSASYIRTPQGHDIIIDGGPDDSILYHLSRVMPWNDKEIDLIILTHPHLDHINGLNKVLENYQVLRVAFSPAFYESEVYKKFLNLVEQEGAIIDHIIAPQEYIFAENLSLNIIFPLNAPPSGKISNIHEYNTVTKVSFEEQAFLFPGDLESDKEKLLVESGVDLQANILMSPHHGSKTSSSSKFLSAVDPEYIIISLGAKNKYGHPNPEVVSRYSQLKSKVFRTDQDGTLHFISDGQNLEQRTYP